MKNNKIAKIILIILCIASIYTYTKVEAKETCTAQEKNNLIQLAHNVKFDYELLPDEGNLNRSFSLTASNLVGGIEIRYGFSTYSYDETSTTPGVIKMNEYFGDGRTHKILIYASSSTNCADQVLATKMVAIPKYNSYSEREECVGIEAFKLCQRWYAGSFTEEEFQQQTKIYKANLTNSSEEKQKKEEKTSILNKFFDLYKERLLISITSSIILIFMIILIIKIIVKKKNKIKIDL